MSAEQRRNTQTAVGAVVAILTSGAIVAWSFGSWWPAMVAVGAVCVAVVSVFCLVPLQMRLLQIAEQRKLRKTGSR